MKKHFLTGIIILMPIALTFIIIVFLIDFLTTPFISFVTSLLYQIETAFHFHISSNLINPVSRIFALLLLFLFILVLGIVARWFIIKQMFAIGDKIISKIPLIKTVYKVSREIFSALFSNDGKKAFKYSCIVPFPFAPSYSLGFQSGEVAEEIQSKVKTPLVSVFMPTAPHPISGFLFFVPEKDAHKIGMTTEESVKFLVSCGIIVSEEDKTKTL
jgi:uncharacterized membrane protein